MNHSWNSHKIKEHDCVSNTQKAGILGVLAGKTVAPKGRNLILFCFAKAAR